MAAPSIEAHIEVGPGGVPAWMVDKKITRKAFRAAGNVIKKESRKRINRKAGVGGYPKKRTGRMAKSLKVTVGSKGMYAKVIHKMPAPPSKWKDKLAFYPAFLVYGTNRGLISRDNWIVDALESKTNEVRTVIDDGFLRAIK